MLMDAFAEYDVAGVEYHHNQKKDSPSGTALEIASTIVGHMDRIDNVPFSSVRCGAIPGTHTNVFDSSCDSIVITHEARNRNGFALGAVQAAEWLSGKNGVLYICGLLKRHDAKEATMRLQGVITAKVTPFVGQELDKEGWLPTSTIK